MDNESTSTKLRPIIASFAGVIILSIILALIIINPFKDLNWQLATSETNADLTAELQAEENSITESFNQRFSFLHESFGGYTVEKVVLLDNGFAAILLQHDLTTYRALMVKNDNTWMVEGMPSPVLYYEDFANIPRNVIKTINDLEVKNE